MTQKLRVLILAFVAVVATLIVAVPVLAADPISGAIFTTNSDCSGVDLNIYGDKDEVYLNGGPAHPNAAGLPDGDYYVQVTEPFGGKVLGQSQVPAVTVSGGEFASCYQLSDIVYSDSSIFT